MITTIYLWEISLWEKIICVAFQQCPCRLNILGALGTPAFAPKHITPGMSNGPHQSSIVTDLHELRNLKVKFLKYMLFSNLAVYKSLLSLSYLCKPREFVHSVPHKRSGPNTLGLHGLRRCANIFRWKKNVLFQLTCKQEKFFLTHIPYTCILIAVITTDLQFIIPVFVFKEAAWVINKWTIRSSLNCNIWYFFGP